MCIRDRFYSILDEFVTGVETHNNGTVNFGLFDVFDDNPLFCDLDSGNYYLAENSLCVNSGENGTHMGVYGIGCNAILKIDDQVHIAELFTLRNPYPNPFNPSTTIIYSIPVQSTVLLQIFDINGRLVKTLDNGIKQPGEYKCFWNPTNVSSGLYFVQMNYGDHVQTQKLILLK